MSSRTAWKSRAFQAKRRSLRLAEMFARAHFGIVTFSGAISTRGYVFRMKARGYNRN